MREKEAKLLGVAFFLGGVITGFLIAPIKKGMYFGNNCGNTFADNDKTSVDNIDEKLEKSIEENSEYK